MTSKQQHSDESAAVAPAIVERMRARLEYLYASQAGACLESLVRIVESHAKTSAARTDWDQRDGVLITYGDQVRDENQPALPRLTEFLTSTGLVDSINTVHILPFYPYSSDDGFSVIDYRRVDSAVGDWSHVGQLAEHVDLMFDLVLNHCSQQSDWFRGYLAGREPFARFFHEVDPGVDLSQVTRPRSLPLLTEFATSRGARHVWTTFSADQVDLNFADPQVLLEFVEILLSYVSHGARIIRLDAVAYLWKEIGTSCIHLPQTHEVVKLLRDVLAAAAPHVLLITETNVPHDENVSYFGDGDEAHLVYQFSLPPLLLDAFLSADAAPLATWLRNLDPPPPGTTFFNFTASHDGIGVRPLEGLVEKQRFDRLVESARSRGAHVGLKRNADGTDSPYELNITYVDALGGDGIGPELHARRFLSSQAIMLALPGIPGIYFHSLVGTQNDYAGAESSGIPRRINRRKFSLEELRGILDQADSLQQRIFAGYQRLLQVRTSQPAFHPDGGCELVDFGSPAIFAFLRTSPDQRQRVLCITNVASQPANCELSQPARDLLNGAEVGEGPLTLDACQSMWLEL